MCNNVRTLFPSYWSRDQPSAQELTKYIWHGTAVPSSGAGVSFCKVVVVAMGAITTTFAIAERDGPRISGPNHGQSLEDGGDGQNVHNLLHRKGLVGQFWAALGDPRLLSSKLGSDMFRYYIWLHVNAYWYVPKGSSLIS